MRLMRPLFVLAVVIGLTAATQHARLQSPAQIGGGPLTHVGASVRDIDIAVRAYADLFGIAVPKVNVLSLDLPNNTKVDIKIAAVTLSNFVIELDQPVTKAGPIYDHLEKFGPGINHIAFAVKGSIDDARALLEQKGGKWTVGVRGGPTAFVDFRDTLGTMLQVTPLPAAPSAPPVIPAGTLAAAHVTHVGFGVKDADQTAKAFGNVLGIPTPEVREYRDSQYPPASRWNRDAFLKLTGWKQENINMELIASVGGPTPWSDFVEKEHGTAAQHIAIDVGNRMDETIREMQMKGGKWTNGKPGGTYAYLDFQDMLGMVFEINGTSKSAPPAAK